MTRSDIKSRIRAEAALTLYGRGFSYDWTIHRNDDTIDGSGASDLYATAQEGDEIRLRINLIEPGRGQFTIDSRHVQL